MQVVLALYIFCFPLFACIKASIIFLSRISDHPIVTKRLFRSTGKAAWIVVTTFIVLAVPLIIETDRELQINEAELHQAILGSPAQPHPAFIGPPM